MPLTQKGQEIMANMKKQYGEKEGEKVFYASRNAGKITGVDDDGEPHPPMRNTEQELREDASGQAVHKGQRIKYKNSKGDWLEADVLEVSTSGRAQIQIAGTLTKVVISPETEGREWRRDDMTDRDWEGIEKFIEEEKKEGEHRGDTMRDALDNLAETLNLIGPRVVKMDQELAGFARADTTVAAVNAELRKMGREEKLTAGRGYYYWRDGDSFQWPSIYVYRIADVDLEWVMKDVRENIKRYG